MRPKLIIFDCDGVLVDSESIASTVSAAEMTKLGWKMTAHEANKIFLGMNLSDIKPVVEAHLGRALAPDWLQTFAANMIAAMQTQTRLMPGAREVLERITAMGFDWRIASNSSDAEMVVKFACTGLTEIVKGRYVSAGRVMTKGGKPKPAPDVYLEAAQDAGVEPSHCLVVEDSPLGVRAAVAAGMRCYGLDPMGDGTRLKAEGAYGVLHQLDELYGVIQ